MNFVGLLSLLLAVAVGVWVYTSSISSDTDERAERTTYYEDALDSARTVVTEVESAVPSSNKIEIYDGISVPEHTEVLDLSGQGLTGSLKAEVRQLSKLRVLNLSDNVFTGLPAEIGQLTQLEVLDLSNNPLTGLPIELGNLQNLQSLDISGTQAAVQDVSSIRARLPADTVIIE